MMDSFLQEVVDQAAQLYGAEVSEFREEVTLLVTAEHILPLCTLLRDTYSFDMLENETAVDYWPKQEGRFHVVYQLYSFTHNVILHIRVPLDGNKPIVPTLEGVFPNANWLEREIWDLMGIRFEGHSDPRRILMPEDWEGHPQRKDYPLGYEEVEFTFNYDQISLHKPAPKKD